jgi:hypothetical protein
MENIFGGLIEFSSEKEFDEFINSVDEHNALTIIEKAIEYAYQKNLFTMPETYFVYKSLKKLKENGFNIGDLELQQG